MLNLLPFVLAMATSMTAPPSQTECGLTQREFNFLVEYLTDEQSGGFDEKLADLPTEVAECVEIVLDTEREFENARIAAKIRHERAQSPAAQAVVTDYGVNPRDIAQVAWVQPIASDRTPLEEIEIVTLDNGERYYYFPEDESTSDTEPPSLLWTNARRERGTSMTNVRGSCWSAEYVVRFPTLPTCFREISPGRIDGIDDAWAYLGAYCPWWCVNSDCLICSGYQCGPAWDGGGMYGWWKFSTGCGGRDASWTNDAGKMVQKRWVVGRGCCNFDSQSTLANSVERLIHW